MKKCKKHIWIKVQSTAHSTVFDLSTGGINLYYGFAKLEVCFHCGKVRGYLDNKTITSSLTESMTL